MLDHEQVPDTEQIALLSALPKKNYSSAYSIKGRNVACYTAKQMKSLYPGGQFEKAFEFAPHSSAKRIARLLLGKSRMPLYRYGSHNRLIYREAGFIALDAGEDSFAVLLKNALPVRAIALSLIAALVVCGVLFAPKLFGADKPGENVEAGIPLAPELEEGAVAWDGTKVKDTGGVVPGIAIPGYKSITVDADTTEAQVNFQNPEGNPCYFVISLVLADGTELYKSKMVEPGKGLYEITLSEALAAGEYDASVRYETFSLNDLAPMNGAQVEIKLIAQ